MKEIILIFSCFFALRLVSLAFSIKNEKRIKQQGGIQYGKFNSMLLTLAHIAFYFLCLFEAIYKEQTLNTVSKVGIGLLIFAYAMLFYVIYELRDVWTLKIYILPDHKINNSFLFKWIKHPNYFLNILPELVGMALLCNAYTTLAVMLPIYAVILAIRIRQEEKAMEQIGK
ncbi:isoprenylcysteine carboxyl methyltransferase family protein [Capnocytophaga sp.]|uniref:isoprenylcysteine carboxyl methyltransferase family protein n=1 Tax=Capnocytophaga sp. TaxID=44737 RepID=UPI0026DD757F|nr:isoprenylcysteine carboxyl methyltransferase family protein [Capnocytophaga sp.]MDO5105614.1 isoprenylcysteine carboxyl methyltransferase family protein [Capnocytophaga sp.]